MRNLFLISFCVLLAVIGSNSECTADSANHKLALGTRGDGDKIIYMKRVMKAAEEGQVLTVDETTGDLLDTINYIEVISVFKNSQNCFTVTKGGVGQHQADFHIESQPGQAINAFIVVFGQ